MAADLSGLRISLDEGDGKMHRITLFFGAILASLVLVAGANAGDGKKKHHGHHYRPTPGFICSDNGTTIPVPDLKKALEMFPDATSGKCPVVEEPPPVDQTPPPVEEPPVVIPDVVDTTHEFLFCYSRTQDDPTALTIERFEFLTEAAQPELGGKPYWTLGFLPSANTTPNGSPLGNGFYAHCNLSGKATGHVTQNGDLVNDVDYARVVIEYGPTPIGYLAIRAS
jgi:hypothetical protein